MSYLLRALAFLIREAPLNKRKESFVKHALLLGHRRFDFTFRCWRSGLIWSARGFPDLLTRYMLFEGHYQPEVLAALRGLVQPGDTVFDVGGHHGLMAIVAAKAAGPTGRVITFEPNELARERMAEHLALNRIENVLVETIALDAEDGERSFFIQTGVVSWNSSFFDQFVQKNNAQRPMNAVIERRVRTMRLDTYVQETGRVPDVIKIDTEGADFLVLAGARETIATHRPKLVLELNQTSAEFAGTSLDAFIDFLDEHGYEIHVLVPNRLGFYSFDRRVPYEREKHYRDWEFNVVCLPRLNRP